MLLIHLIVVVMLGLIFLLMTILNRQIGPIPPLLSFVSWLSAAYQSLVTELPYATTSSPVTVTYEAYSGGGALALYFVALAGVSFLYFMHAIWLEATRK